MVSCLAETATGKVTVGEDFLLLGNGTDRLLLTDGAFLLLAPSAPPTFSITTVVANGSGTWAALNPTVSTASGAVTVTPSAASGTFVAHSATTTIATSVGGATASASADNVQAVVETSADDVTGDWDALDATVVTAAVGTVAAQVATGSIVIGEAAHALGPVPTTATATVDTNDAAPVITSPNPDPSPYAQTYALDASGTYALVAAGTYLLDATRTYHVKR